MEKVLKKCQYAGDPNDEYCRNCNGVTMLVDGEELSCIECTAYSPANDTNIPDKVDEPLTIGDTTDDKKEEGVSETPQAAQNDVPDVKTEDSASEEEKQATEAPGEACDTSVEVEETISDSDTTYLPDGVTVTALRYMSGVTISKTEPSGSTTYYKFSAEEEWKIDERVGADSEKVESIREALWDKLNLEVDSQVGEVLNG